ncbi:methylated-DNA--protein-cysteine methyltransferase-like [Carettochelys insculpta]|uniref:methylated-DNA--protein-cysteine methyltransferase-like n=1 Tax=Carettochelys insculpta TaxID=44489 RepID=UPI003EB791A0
MTDETFIQDSIDSPVGRIVLITDGPRLVALDFDAYHERTMRLLKRSFPKATVKEGRAPKAVIAALERYFAAERTALDGLEVRLGGTDFQRSVWTALRRIPWGQTRSYRDLAEMIGKPTAMRAVGLANGQNPIAIVVPCHRVIGADGSLTGYAGGLERKRALLTLEGATLLLL